ncbi:MAG: thioredoxin-disulfide reductase [Deltaproteobacteria bacterium CG_4_10_14_0_2_um_filter_43_8]|nr:MAG: thioredoxin-disulfide reductase [Deltaproteobacteria bacterium CG11_big_fil_rev_8_21_14_0_20_42_23]PJA21934.1 MAG: thioredoxin-disulfide reductase [Deltaproteobacteria bacterium CG_4_10_14_0_2_um_filter_43_8]
MVHNVIIIGSGAAGYTAAIYAARAELQPLLFEGSQPGGQLTITTDVENFPGFEHGIMGPQLMQDMRKQALRFETKMIQQTITTIDTSKRPFVLTTDTGETYQAKTIIVATGATAKLLGVENEMKLMGKGVSACATCDGFFFKGLEIVIVGGGDTAMEEATFLTKFASKVTVIHRRDSLRASKIMQQKAFENPKIEFIWDTEVIDVHGVDQDKLTGIRLKNLKTGEESDFACEGLFIAIGHKPNTEFLKGKLELDDVGYIITKKSSMATSVDGIYACGDAQDSIYRQAITAAGTGCMAAIDVERFLQGHE